MELVALAGWWLAIFFGGLWLAKRKDYRQAREAVHLLCQRVHELEVQVRQERRAARTFRSAFQSVAREQ